MAAPDVVVFAAGSLADAFAEIGALYEARHPGARARFAFASADHLRQRLVRGEPADVFASANVAELERAREDGVLAGPIRLFAHNRLRVIVSRRSPRHIEGLVDLARPGIRLAVEHATAPLSGYTRLLLERAAQDPAYGADFAERVAANVAVHVVTVRELVARVAEGDADAGIVYVTDVTPDRRADVTAAEIPDHVNVTADYAIGCVGAGERAEAIAGGREFVSLVLYPAGQSILERWGFRRGVHSNELRE